MANHHHFRTLTKKKRFCCKNNILHTKIFDHPIVRIEGEISEKAQFIRYLLEN